ncbi:MAG: hypothetical protein JO342_19670, partial [Solirubrobacterales bacterium]|nr:hypothetical protein [Solirubrobacterales bacterium]
RDNTNLPNCVRATTNTSNPLPLPQVHLRQFSSTVSGNTENNASGVTVTVTVQREGAIGPVTVATGSSTTKAGVWSVSLGHHAVGDDRDVITVTYSGSGAPTPRSEQILTGNGGNPFTQSGWTGWVDMDHGSFLTNTQTVQGIAPPSLTLEPCFQTGVEAFSIDGVAGSLSPTEFCNTSSDSATAPLSSPVGKGQAVAWSSLDNRAFTPPSDPNPNLIGALVKLRVPVGEADSLSSFSNPLVAIPPGGFPTCTGDLEAQTVTCSGLVPGETYTVKDASKSASGKADPTGTVSVALAIKRGDTVSLSNGARTLTTLHVANLRAVISDQGSTLSGGQCQPGAYYGPPVSSPPTNASAGSIVGGIALTGVICPLSGKAAGLPSASIMQTDEFSGGQTQTEVPLVRQITPTNGAIVPASFLARAAPKLSGKVVPGTIALTITSSGKTVFTSKNVNAKSGVKVSGLKPGFYQATWTLTDTNGDVRTRVTRFSVQ